MLEQLEDQRNLRAHTLNQERLAADELYEFVYLIDAIYLGHGTGAAVALQNADTEMMQLNLNEILHRVVKCELVVLLMDGA